MESKKQIKIAYFPSETSKVKVLGSNGRTLDIYCIKCETTEGLSGYTLDATFLTQADLHDILKEEAILKVSMDYGDEIFRVSKVDASTRYIYVVARQITIADSLTLWLEDVRPTNLNGAAACNYLLTNSEGRRKDIQILSNIPTLSTAYYQQMSLYKALYDCDQAFIDRWGGETLRRGYTMTINTTIGTDRGFIIREGKNLSRDGFQASTNIDKLITRARGKGFNGIQGDYIHSPLIDSYNSVYTDVIDYQDVRVKDETNDEGYDTLEEAQAELNRRIEEEFEKNGIDKIKASYNINFVQLEKTEQYKNYIAAERLFLGDTIRVYVPKLDTDIKVRAIEKRYDVLAQRTKEVKLSNYAEPKPPTINQIIDRLESMDSTENILQMAKDTATSLIKSGMKNSYVLVRENEILIMDTKDINTATKVWRFNSGGLGYSNTGYNGSYGLAMTMDGAIVADFITTGVLNANLIKTGVLSSIDGSITINLSNGEFKSTLEDGSEIVISPAEGFYNKFGTSKRGYHHLNFSQLIKFPADSLGGYSTVDVQLPAEFKGKTMQISTSVKRMVCNNASVINGALNLVDSFTEYNATTNIVTVYGLLKVVNLDTKALVNFNQYLEVQLEVIA